MDFSQWNATQVTNNWTQQEHGHNLTLEFATSLGIFFIILPIVAILCNIVLIGTVISNRALHSSTNAFIISLAVSDLLIAMFVIPQDALFLLKGHHVGGRISCGFKEALFFLSLPASVLNLLLLTIERYAKIISPYKHRFMFCKRNTAIMLTLLWLYTIIVALYPILNPLVVHSYLPIFVFHGVCWLQFPLTYVFFQLCANFMAPTLILLVLNGLMLAVAQKHSKSINQLSVASANKQSCMSVSWVNMLRNMKAAKTIALLVGVFLTCWLTFLITAAINVRCNECLRRELTWLANGINYTSCALNPIIYGLLNRPIRNALPCKKTKKLKLSVSEATKLLRNKIPKCDISSAWV